MFLHIYENMFFVYAEIFLSIWGWEDEEKLKIAAEILMLKERKSTGGMRKKGAFDQKQSNTCKGILSIGLVCNEQIDNLNNFTFTEDLNPTWGQGYM